MDASDLARWTRFAAKGGIGKCTALQDCVAQGLEDLMFLKDDEIVVLLQLPQEDQYLGYCEDVVGRFHGSAVQFHGKLKKPVFAKRHSTPGTSPSRPFSLSTPSPPPGSSPANGSSSKLVTSPTTSPLGRSLPVPSSSDGRGVGAKSSLSTRLSASISTPVTQARLAQPHDRTPSNASSTSHHGTRSRSRSQPRESSPLPAPTHLQAHSRKASTASSRSAYSIGSHPSSRPSSRSESIIGSGSEETHTQHVSIPPPLPATQATPALTDASSAHSSFLFSPVPVQSLSSPQQPQSMGTAPAALFQGRKRSGSEKVSRQDTPQGRQQSRSEDVLLPANRLFDKWDHNNQHNQVVVAQEHARSDIPAAGLSETSFRSVSVYSDTSGQEEGDEGRGSNHKSKHMKTRGAMGVVHRGILNEDESDEGGRRQRLSPSPDDLSDAGFGIGMTLLREDEDDESEYDDESNRDPEDDDTAIGHMDTTEHEMEKIQTMRKLKTLPMRVVNRGSISTSATESETGEDDTIMPIPIKTHVVTPVRNSSSSDTVLPASRQPLHTAAIVPPRAPFATHTPMGSRASSSLAPTEDEQWESDADIYDDYRYSRYSTHYSGSPAQHSSRRASRGSTKSGRSRGSERPPLPDEEAWKRNLATAETAEENTTRRSHSSEHSSLSGKTRTSTGTDSKPVSSGVASFSHLFTRGSLEANSTVKDLADTPVLVKSRTPSPVEVVAAEGSIPPTPGTATFGIDLTSPLTRAFRNSDDSKYSSASGVIDDEVDEGQDRHTDRSETSARDLPSPDTEDQASRSKSPALASSIREKIESERRTMSPSPNLEAVPRSARSAHLSVITAPVDKDSNVVILNESPVNDDSAVSRPLSPADADSKHLRVGTPQSHQGSAPPSPLNPGFPPSPSTMASFAPTAPLTITKSPVPSPSTPRQPISPPAIPFVGVPPPGRPPAHMQQYTQQPHQQYPQSTMQQQQQQQWSGSSVPPSDSLYSTLRLAGQQRANTIHGRTQTDLLTAAGPVPISFLLPGMLPPPTAGLQQGSLARPHPASQPAPYGQLASPAQGSVLGRSPESQSGSSPLQGQDRPSHDSPTPTTSQSMRRPLTVPAPPPGVTSSFGNSNPPASPVTAVTPRTTTSIQVMHSGTDSVMAMSTPASPLPRANFFPQVGQTRPRSRSFSGFHSDITEKVSQTLRKRSQEEGSRPFHASTVKSRSTSPSPKMSTTQLQPASPSLLSTQGKGNQVSRPSHGPSPLSLPPTTSELLTAPPRSPVAVHAPVSSTLSSRTTPVSMKGPDSSEAQPKRGNLRKASSHLSLRSTAPTSTPSALPSSVAFPPQRRDSGHSAISGQAFDEEQSSLKTPSPFKPSYPRQSHESDRTQISVGQSEKASPTLYNSSSPSPSPLIRNGSLRSKLSMSALKSKGTARSIRDGGVSETSANTTNPTSTADEETVQIKDLEFELIRPAIPHMSPDHRGEEGTDSKDVLSIRTADLRRDSSSIRSEALSPDALSPTDRRVFGSMNSSGDSFSKKARGPQANTSVQAHRDRELKWVSTINSSDSAQAKKSKKIKKLLIDGVPSSVRYLVWAHISNSGSKKMPNVYTQLSKRRPVMAQDIERDVEQSFPDHPHLRDPKGPLVAVLFAYIAMVPDLRYHRGLAIIAGHLLLQSPEEDAFWTFLAMMDSYLRPYFMPASPQMDIDTNLFVKTVETIDSQLATRVFAQLNVRAIDLCGVWFSSVFAGTLPLEHLHRVWDLFLYEGVPMLFRVGITILCLCRRYLLEAPKGPVPSYMAYLLRPPPHVLPADPEQFIAQVLAVKLRDEDIRKSRVKMEAAAKQQRLTRNSVTQPSHPHLQNVRARVS